MKTRIFSITVFILLLAFGVTQAATLKVTSDADSGPGTLRDRVLRAVDGDTIVFSPCITLIVLDSQIAITQDITIDGNHHVTISGNNQNRIFLIGSGADVTLDDLILINGSAANGGAIQNRGVLHINDSIFFQNTSDDGGAIDTFAGSRLFIKDSEFDNNFAQGQGGAIDVSNNATANIINTNFFGNSSGIFAGAINNLGTLNIEKSTFAGNRANFVGGAIVNRRTLNIIDTSFIDNTADSGGAIINISGTLNIEDSDFLRNTATAVSGGAIVNNINGTLNVNNSEFKENTAVLFGGAVYNNGTFNASESEFKRNVAGTNGGAIYNDTSATFTQQNLTFEDNVPNDIAP